MTGAEKLAFGNELQARWPNTNLLTCKRSWELCEAFEFAKVLTAMDQLRRAMSSSLQIVDGDRLAAICRRVSGLTREWTEPSDEPAARTSEYLAECARNGAAAAAEFERMRDKIHGLDERRRKRLLQRALGQLDLQYPLVMCRRFREHGEQSAMVLITMCHLFTEMSRNELELLGAMT